MVCRSAKKKEKVNTEASAKKKEDEKVATDQESKKIPSK